LKRILAVDPGDVRIGLAVSDPLGVIARPLAVIQHINRDEDARAILATAMEQEAGCIIVGVPLDQEGNPGPQARKSLRLVEKLRERGDVDIMTWDETGSTQAALRGPRKDPLIDARAAAYILQEFLDAQAR